jgi:hypothetical protein
MSDLLADLAVFDRQSTIPPSRYFPLSAIYSGKLLKAFNKSGSLKLIHFFLLHVYPPFFKLQHLSLSLPPIFDLYLVFPGSRTFRYTTPTYLFCLWSTATPCMTDCHPPSVMTDRAGMRTTQTQWIVSNAITFVSRVETRHLCWDVCSPYADDHCPSIDCFHSFSISLRKFNWDRVVGASPGRDSTDDGSSAWA